jgi:glyoxylase-like metal-dependent hydrolase (beta-lactamase superfamily II)
MVKTILPGLSYFTGLMVGRVYCIEDGDGLTIIDASLPPAGNQILKQVQAMGRQPADIKRILITHAHPDHVGALPLLKERTGAQVMASAQERPVIEGKVPVPRAPGRLRPPETRYKGTPVDRVLSEGDVLPEVMGGLQVLFTPGHAPGHLAFWQPEKRILFCGDVIFHFRNLTLPFSFLTGDVEENKRSVRRLAGMDAAVVCFGHGEPLVENAAQAIRDFAERVGRN